MSVIYTLEEYTPSGEVLDEIFVTADEIFVLLHMFKKDDFRENDEIVLTPTFSICRYEVGEDK